MTRSTDSPNPGLGSTGLEREWDKDPELGTMHGLYVTWVLGTQGMPCLRELGLNPANVEQHIW